MRLKLLGSSAGKPVPRPFCRCRVCRAAKLRGGRDRRTRTAMQVFLPGDDEAEPRTLLDLGADLCAQMQRDGFNLDRLEHLLMTHGDVDHFDPFLLKIRTTVLSPADDMPPLTLHAHPLLCDRIGDSGLDLARARVTLHPVAPYQPFACGGLRVDPLVGHHTPDALNFVVEHAGRSALLAWDTGLWPEANWAHIAGRRLDAVFMECTSLGPRAFPRDARHLNFAHLLEMRARLLELDCIAAGTPFITVHIGDNGGLTHAEAVALAAPHGITVGYDGLAIDPAAS